MGLAAATSYSPSFSSDFRPKNIKIGRNGRAKHETRDRLPAARDQLFEIPKKLSDSNKKPLRSNQCNKIVTEK
jgi:hypothetical protein